MQASTLRQRLTRPAASVRLTSSGKRQFSRTAVVPAAKKTGYLWHTLYGWDDRGSGSFTPADPAAGLQPISHHFAHPDTKRRAHELVVVSGLIKHLVQIEPRPATDEEVLSFHTPELLARIKHESTLPKGGDGGDGVSPFGKGGFEIGMLATGGAIEMVKAVVEGKVNNGYALVHPCGHHSIADKGMGFCIFNNSAVAAKYAQEKLGVKRIVVLDWDVHHGNGTQACFWDDPSVLTISIHQNRCFPLDSGFHDEIGGPSAAGSNLNIPLLPGSGNGAYEYAIDSVITPALEAFQPDLIIVASGADPNMMDPLARAMVTSEGFRMMTRKMMALADKLCSGKLAMIQEGGYSPAYVPICIHAMIEELCGVRKLGADPFAPLLFGQYSGDFLLEEHQKTFIDKCQSLLKAIPTP